MGNIEIAMKFSRLKSICSIEDNYLEAATGGVLRKKLFKNFSIFTGKQLCWRLFLIKLQAFRCFPVYIANFFLRSIYERLLIANFYLS